MSNGQLITEIGELMDQEQMQVKAYRRLMLRSVAGVLDKADAMDNTLQKVCLRVEVHDDEIKTLRKRDNLNNIITGVLASIATIVGIDK